MLKGRALKKIISVSLAAAMVFGAGFTAVGSYIGANVSVSAAGTLTYNDFEYIINDENKIEITKYKGKGGNVTIPSKINGKSVEIIGEESFSKCVKLTGVTIPNSVTNIYAYAFADCTGLTSITIPDSVEYVRMYAFCGCTGLKSVTIGKKVITMNSAFRDCTSLTSVTVPDSVFSMDAAFLGCTNLKNVTIGNGVDSMVLSFCDCTSLTSITIPNGVKVIDAAFEGCTGLTSITIPGSVKEMDGTFAGCTSLKTVTVSDGVTSIGIGEFDGCTSLESIIIPASVKTVKKDAFNGCKNFKIYGAKGSYIETYANTNKLSFAELKELKNNSKISANNIIIGGTVTINAKADGGIGDCTYAVLYKKKSDTKWTVKQNYSKNSSVIIKPAKATDYDVCVKVKDNTGKIIKKFFAVKVNDKLKNTSTISATKIKKGNTVTLKGSATGGTGGYNYAALYKKKSETKWTTRQGYKSNSEILVRPYTNTDYDICIKVKDKDGTIEKKYFTVTVTK